MCKGNLKKYIQKLDEYFNMNFMKLSFLVATMSLVIVHFRTVKAEVTSSPSPAETVKSLDPNAPEETKLLVICKKEKGVRTLRIVKQSDLCTVKYTKGTSVESIGEGKWFPFCEKIADGVRGNLEKAGYTCKVTKNNSVSELK